MELLYKGDKKNELYRLSPEEKMMLLNYDFQWCNSRNISGFQLLNNDLIIRLHNGSMYLFENVLGKVTIKLSTTIRDDLIGKLIRKKINYYYVGVIRMKFDSNETDKELLYFYVEDKNLDRTIKLDKYALEKINKEFSFNMPSDDSILGKEFFISAINKKNNLLIEVGIIKIQKIIESNWKDFIKIYVSTTSGVESSITFIKRKYGNNIDYVFSLIKHENSISL